MKTIKFVKPHSPYAVDDIAGLPDKEAGELIEAGIAVPFKKNGKEEVQLETEAVEEPAQDTMIKTPIKKK